MYVAYYPKQLKKNYSLGVRIVCRDLRPAEANFLCPPNFCTTSSHTKHNPELARQLQCQNTIESNRLLPSSKNSHFSKQGLVQNLSYENEFYSHENKDLF